MLNTQNVLVPLPRKSWLLAVPAAPPVHGRQQQPHRPAEADDASTANAAAPWAAPAAAAAAAEQIGPSVGVPASVIAVAATAARSLPRHVGDAAAGGGGGGRCSIGVDEPSALEAVQLRLLLLFHGVARGGGAGGV